MRTIKEPDIRKQEILNAALRVFGQKGYEKSSIADIAQAAGISQGLCYRYFASKESIYDAVIETYAECIAQLAIPHFQDASLDLKTQIRLFCGQTDRYVQMEQSHAELYELFHRTENRHMHEHMMLRVAGKLTPFLAQTLQKAKDNGEIRVNDAEAAACFIAFGQMGMMLSAPNASLQRIQNCLLELLGLAEE